MTRKGLGQAVGIGGRTALEGYGRTVFQHAFPVTNCHYANITRRAMPRSVQGLCKWFRARSAAPALPSCWSPFFQGQMP
jgi:hypothetical protein